MFLGVYFCFVVVVFSFLVFYLCNAPRFQWLCGLAVISDTGCCDEVTGLSFTSPQ